MKEWTSQELAILRQNAHHGAEYIAQVLNRSLPSVKRQAQRHRISLRKPGERRGIILGQPGRVRWAEQVRAGVPIERLEQLRQQVLDGQVDMATLEAKVRERIHGRPKPLCPACSERPQERSTTGLCEVCHWRELARAHRLEADRAAARRDLDAARQEASRARRAANVVDLKRQ